jgi:hypothetical protein
LSEATRDGQAPDKPGLGGDFKEDIASRHSYVPVTRQQLRFSDGGIADH